MSVLVRTAASFLVNKLVAVLYGPGGITILSQLQNILAIFNNIPSDGINRGLTKYLSSENTSTEQKTVFFRNGLLLTVIHFIVIGVYFSIHAKGWEIILPASEVSISTLAIVGFLSLVVLLSQVGIMLQTVTAASLNVKKYALMGILTHILSSLLFVSCIYIDSMYQMSAIIVLGQAFYLVAALILGAEEYLHYFKNFSLKIDPAVSKQLGAFVLMALSTLVFGKIVDLYVREFTIEKFNLIETGYWQSVVKLSDSYTMVFSAVIGAVYFPKISSLLQQEQELKKYVSKVFYFTLTGSCIALGIVAILKEEILHLLFSAEFKKAAYLVNYQLGADVLKLSSWVLGYIMSAQARTTLFIVSQAVSALVYVLLIYWLTSLFGMEGMTMANFIRFIGYFIFLAIIYRKLIS